jgi:hypothetical protein
MPRVTWRLHGGRPSVEVILTHTTGGQTVTRTLLADTGAGAVKSPFELLLHDADCLSCGAPSLSKVRLGRAYRGQHPAYRIRVRVPGLGFDQDLPVVGITSLPTGFDGVACFRFMNRFTYGNFGNFNEFGLEL